MLQALLDLNPLLVICPFVLLAGFLDGSVGGGGLVSLPAYLLAGLPVHVAYGTNKFANGIGMAAAAGRFIKSGNVNWRLCGWAIPGALLGAWWGARLALFLPEHYLQLCLLVLLPLTAVFLLPQGRGKAAARRPRPMSGKTYALAFACGGILGAYDGFFGPGTGTFLILAFTQVLRLDLVTASGNAKIVNVCSSLLALILFIRNGGVWFWVAIPAALCAVLGNWLGALLTIRKGGKLIRPLLLAVVALLFLKILLDVLSG